MAFTMDRNMALSSQEVERLALTIAGIYSVPSDAGGAVTDGASGLDVDVAAITANKVIVNSVLDTTGESGATVTIDAADGSNPRRDWVYYEPGVGFDSKAGTPAALSATSGPVLPDLDSDQIALAEVYVDAGATTLSSADITDKRLASPQKTTTLFIPASAMVSPSTNGAADGSTDGTNFSYRTKDFDNTTEEHADLQFYMPDKYAGGNLTWKGHWTAAAGSAAQTIAIELNMVSQTDDDVFDQSLTDIGSLTDALIATGDYHETSELTQSSNLPTAGKLVTLRVSRDVAADNLAADMKLIGLTLTFVENLQ